MATLTVSSIKWPRNSEMVRFLDKVATLTVKWDQLLIKSIGRPDREMGPCEHTPTNKRCECGRTSFVPLGLGDEGLTSLRLRRNPVNYASTNQVWISSTKVCLSDNDGDRLCVECPVNLLAQIAVKGWNFKTKFSADNIVVSLISVEIIIFRNREFFCKVILVNLISVEIGFFSKHRIFCKVILSPMSYGIFLPMAVNFNLKMNFK